MFMTQSTKSSIIGIGGMVLLYYTGAPTWAYILAGITMIAVGDAHDSLLKDILEIKSSVRNKEDNLDDDIV